MINIIKENFKRALVAKIFSIITIGTLSFLSFKTQYGLFLVGSFGASMVLVFGYPESPFAQPKNVFFWPFYHFISGCISFKLFFYRTTLFVFADCYRCRTWNIFNDIIRRHTPSCRRQPNIYNTWWSYLPIFIKPYYFRIYNNYSLRNYFK
jgi:hypothetical protein